MKKIQLLLVAVLTVFAITNGIMSYSQEKGSDNNKQRFATPKEAAETAKQHMMEAMGTVNFGVNKDQLEGASPETAITRYGINWEALLKADANTRLENIVQKADKVDMVPLVNGRDVVTIISLKDKDGGYGIGAIGNTQLSEELNVVRKLAPTAANGGITIYEVPNLDAIVYVVDQQYYTSYKTPLRKAQTSEELMKLLQYEAADFQRRFGDELKKENLLK